jgi:urea carboxylase
MGQARPGDGVRFIKTTIESAVAARLSTDRKVELLREAACGSMTGFDAVAALESFQPEVPACPATTAVLATLDPSDSHPGAQLRLAGDRYVFLEYGPMELDLNLRVRVKQVR